jgi:hypothetical protein
MAAARDAVPAAAIDEDVLAAASFTPAPAVDPVIAAFASFATDDSTAAAASASSSASASHDDHRRRLQYGTYSEEALAVLSNASSTSRATYDWRIDSTLVDITFVRDRAFQTTCSSLNITFEAFDGVITGIAGLYACAGSTPGWCDLADPVPIADGDLLSVSGTATTIALTGLDLPTGTIIFGTVFALSGAGTVATVSTNGITCEDRPPSADGAVVYDVGPYHAAAPALPGSGRAGRGAIPAYDIDCDVAGLGFGAAWAGFEFFFPPARFEWAVGTTPGGDDVVPWTSVGLTTSAYDPDATVVPGTVAYASVRAYDAAGRVAEQQSDGVLVLPPGLELADGAASEGVGGSFVCHGSPASLGGLYAAPASEDMTGVVGLAPILAAVE